MKYLHTMVRVTDIEQSLRFYRDALGLVGPAGSGFDAKEMNPCANSGNG